MGFILMLRDEEVAHISIKNGSLVVKEIFDYDRLPIHAQYAVDKEEALNEYFMERTIPSVRRRYSDVLSLGQVNSGLELAIRDRLLSLNDQFWIRKPKEEIHWEEVNFFDNEYSYEVGNYMLSLEDSIENFITPDLTTGGNQPKSWRKVNGENYLFKSGKEPYAQEPYNEVFVSQIAKDICKCKVVEYKHCHINGLKGCRSMSFLNEHTSLVTAADVFATKEKLPNLDNYEHLCSCCKRLGIKGYRQFIDAMIAFDYVIRNSDRHLGNFGFLYDTRSLKFIGPAPLYDNGTSLWSECDEEAIKSKAEEEAKPFFLSHDEQIGLINDVEHVINLSALKGLKGKLAEHFKGYDDKRTEVLSKNFDQRIDLVGEKLAEMQIESKKEKRNIKEVGMSR